MVGFWMKKILHFHHKPMETKVLLLPTCDYGSEGLLRSISVLVRFNMDEYMPQIGYLLS